jgi:hypothetical protein
MKYKIIHLFVKLTNLFQSKIVTTKVNKIIFFLFFIIAVRAMQLRTLRVFLGSFMITWYINYIVKKISFWFRIYTWSHFSKLLMFNNSIQTLIICIPNISSQCIATIFFSVTIKWSNIFHSRCIWIRVSHYLFFSRWTNWLIFCLL